MERNLGTLRDLLTQSGGPPVDLMGDLGGKARSAAAVLSESSEETVGAIEGRKRKHPTLVICDETYAIGPLAIMQKAAGIIRGYGVRMWWILQNPAQLVEMYPRNWETFFATSGQVQMFSINDKTAAEYLSEMIGKCRVWAKKKIRNGQGKVIEVELEPAGSFPLRDPSEIARTISREGGLQVVLREGADPFLLRRVKYDKLFWPHQYAPDPFEPGSRSWRRTAWSLVWNAKVKLEELMK
jgi:type IV secretory pathway TraG/TraD family ATPase VirD4